MHSPPVKRVTEQILKLVGVLPFGKKRRNPIEPEMKDTLPFASFPVLDPCVIFPSDVTSLH